MELLMHKADGREEENAVRDGCKSGRAIDGAKSVGGDHERQGKNGGRAGAPPARTFHSRVPRPSGALSVLRMASEKYGVRRRTLMRCPHCATMRAMKKTADPVLPARLGEEGGRW